jgi:hypothetical protein
LTDMSPDPLWRAATPATCMIAQRLRIRASRNAGRNKVIGYRPGWCDVAALLRVRSNHKPLVLLKCCAVAGLKVSALSATTQAFARGRPACEEKLSIPTCSPSGLYRVGHDRGPNRTGQV